MNTIIVGVGCVICFSSFTKRWRCRSGNVCTMCRRRKLETILKRISQPNVKSTTFNDRIAFSGECFPMLSNARRQNTPNEIYGHRVITVVEINLRARFISLQQPQQSYLNCPCFCVKKKKIYMVQSEIQHTRRLCTLCRSRKGNIRKFVQSIHLP